MCTFKMLILCQLSVIALLQDMAGRSARKQLEFVWRGSQSWGPASDIFGYNYPTGKEHNL